MVRSGRTTLAAAAPPAPAFMRGRQHSSARRLHVSLWESTRPLGAARKTRRVESGSWRARRWSSPRSAAAAAQCTPIAGAPRPRSLGPGGQVGGEPFLTPKAVRSLWQ